MYSSLSSLLFFVLSFYAGSNLSDYWQLMTDLISYSWISHDRNLWDLWSRSWILKGSKGSRAKFWSYPHLRGVLPKCRWVGVGLIFGRYFGDWQKIYRYFGDKMMHGVGEMGKLPYFSHFLSVNSKKYVGISVIETPVCPPHLRGFRFLLSEKLLSGANIFLGSSWDTLWKQIIFAFWVVEGS